jgi:hypothetical protein
MCYGGGWTRAADPGEVLVKTRRFFLPVGGLLGERIWSLCSGLEMGWASGLCFVRWAVVQPFLHSFASNTDMVFWPIESNTFVRKII